MRSPWIGILLTAACAGFPASASADSEIRIERRRLSDRVLVLTEDTMNNNIVVVSSSQGLIIFDTSGSPSAAARIHEVIREEFPGRDVAYVVNTHHHWDHSFGDGLFPEAQVVGHEGCTAPVREYEAGLPRRIERMHTDLAESRTRLAGLDSSSTEAADLRRRIEMNGRLVAEYERGMTFRPPTISFSDRLTVNLGDLTLKLFYFGRAHSGTDILVVVPEEGLLITGDLFLDRRWLPLFAGMDELDIPRWIDVLHTVLDGSDSIRTVLPGHLDLWTPEKLRMWRDYIVALWEGVKAADAEGLDLAAARERLPLGERYYYLRELGHSDETIRRYHDDNLRAFWRQLKESAADEVGRVLADSGAAAARARFLQLRADPRHRFLFEEAAFNSLGYRWMADGRIPEAIEVFKMNVEVFPEAWNAHDSLAEAYRNAGQRDLAVQHYRRSIELNPENENGKRALGELEMRP